MAPLIETLQTSLRMYDNIINVVLHTYVGDPGPQGNRGQKGDNIL